ncbi:GNAT family N-acetyltransferase [Candidatus Binatus sp.]|uniref:GNAT family N-acetyltransferase n=1 Tax=Candidatus Binatus sp. TaxID=2811406 RepID=UPI003BAECF23
MNVVVCGENRRADWEELIAQSADATSGHLWNWRDVVSSAYGFDPHYLLAQDSRGRPVAAAPFIFVRSLLYGSELSSMPYLDYGGICHTDVLDSAERAAADADLIAYARELASKLRAKRLHIRSLKQMQPPFEISTEKVAQHLALSPTIDEQMRRLPSERRNRLKRIEKLELGVDVSDATDPAALTDFCATYSENMRDLGSPTHGRRFFSNLVNRFRDRLSLIRVRSKGRVVAAGLAMNFRGSMMLPWSGATFEARPVYATNALYWRAIQLGIESGCHTFDFGRSSVGSGIFEFKRQWGPTPVQPYWSTLYLSPHASAPRERKSLQTISRLWRHMPLGMARAFGPGLRRGISN